MENNNGFERLVSSLEKLETKKNIIYFLTYDTKSTHRAAIKYIYDCALVLKNNGYHPVILVEDKNYTGIKSWLEATYDEIEIMTIKDDRIELGIEDVIVVPEYYSNALPQLQNIRSIKVILIQQKEYLYETLSIGSRWSDFGFEKCITTTEGSKKYISEYFPEELVYVNPPFIDDIFHPISMPTKPYIAISCRDRVHSRRIISEFYLKYPQLRWITFRDMVQMSYQEFSEVLSECMVSVWVDNDSTFGTFPLESMKCGVPVVGKIPNTEPDWMGVNGMWTYDISKITEILGTYVLSWLDGVELTNEVKQEIRSTYEPYNMEIFTQNTISIFNSLISARINSIKTAIEKFKTKENEKDINTITNS